MPNLQKMEMTSNCAHLIIIPFKKNLLKIVKQKTFTYMF